MPVYSQFRIAFNSSRGFVTARIAGLALIALALSGCAGRPGPPLNLPAPVQSTTVGPGDVFTVVVVGEKELPTEFRVQPDGTIDFPYIDRVTVSNLEPQDIVVLLKKRLVEAKVLQAPQVMVIVKQYNSKKVTVIGSVTKPGNVAWTEGMGIVDAISQAGWFTPIGDSNHRGRRGLAVVVVAPAGDSTGGGCSARVVEARAHLRGRRESDGNRCFSLDVIAPANERTICLECASMPSACAHLRGDGGYRDHGS